MGRRIELGLKVVVGLRLERWRGGGGPSRVAEAPGKGETEWLGREGRQLGPTSGTLHRFLLFRREASRCIRIQLLMFYFLSTRNK